MSTSSTPKSKIPICPASKNGFTFNFPEIDESAYHTRKTIEGLNNEASENQIDVIQEKTQNNEDCPAVAIDQYEDSALPDIAQDSTHLNSQYALSNPTTAAGGIATLSGVNSMSLSKRNRCFAEDPVVIYEEELARSIAAKEYLEQQRQQREIEEQQKLQREAEEAEENRRTAESTDAVLRLMYRVNETPGATYKLPPNTVNDIAPSGRLYRQSVLAISSQKPEFCESLRISDVKQPGSLSIICKK